jgi:PAS domain S-box-containing protein
VLDLRFGQSGYPWKNPGEDHWRKKLCLFNSIDDYNWIVGSASYLDEFYEPLRTAGLVLAVIFSLTMLLVLPLTERLSGSITESLDRLKQFFEQASAGNFRLRMAVAGHNEIGTLANYFNNFMTQLETYSSSLKAEIEVRRAVENNLRESEERYRSVMEAAADPIVIYNMQGRAVYFNPAFAKVFGWSLAESRGGKMDHFVPEENWPETAMMIKTVQAGGVLPATETKRTAKDGTVISVSISGAAYRDNHHTLIGIAGLTAVLKHRIEQSGLTETDLADLKQFLPLLTYSDFDLRLCRFLVHRRDTGCVRKPSMIRKLQSESSTK